MAIEVQGLLTSAGLVTRRLAACDETGARQEPLNLDRHGLTLGSAGEADVKKRPFCSSKVARNPDFGVRRAV